MPQNIASLSPSETLDYMGSQICVSIGRGRHRHMIAEHKHVAEQGGKLVELRLDFLQTPPNLKRLLAERPCPVVVTVRRTSDGGLWQGTEQDRMMLIRTAIAEGVDYIDLEEDIAGKVPRFGKTKRIVSYHNFQETPEDLEGLHARLAALNADVVKIATMAHDPHDNVRMLQIVKNAKVPTVAFCMGDIGTPSRILIAKYGAPFSFATFHIERTMAPGQLGYAQMRDVYRYEQINSHTEFYGVIADPVAHSLSPLVHNAAFAKLGLNKVYLPFRVPREHLSQFLVDCDELDIRGLSVTIPHKEAIVPALTKSDDVVTGVSAANTIIFKDGDLLGYNTDSRAALARIEHTMATETGEHSLAGKTALVLGAGGAARALVYGLRRRACDVVVSARTLEKAEALAEQFKARAVEWQLRHTVSADLIVNCTPVGMHPHVNETPYEGVHFKPEQVVFDTVYNPEQTLMLKEAKETECTIIPGIDMFVGQAAAQFKLFSGGQDAPIDVMKQEIRRAISAVKVS